MSGLRRSRLPHPMQEIIGPEVPPQAWGGRYFLSHLSGGKSPKSSPLIFTPQYKEPRFFWLQMRFAIDQGLLAKGTPGQPALPWSEKMVNAGTAIGEITFKVSRSVNEQGGSLDDVYVVSGGPTVAGQSLWFPLMLAPGAQITINAENTGDLDLWIDASAVPLQTLTNEQLLALRWSTASFGQAANGLSSRPNVFGFGTVPGDPLGNGPIVTPASSAAVTLLPADQSRRQFWITNESTNARLALRFAAQDPDVPASKWDVILDPKGTGNQYRYQSPVDAYWGEVRGQWDNVAPNGVGVASGAIYLLQETDTPL